MLRAYPQAAAGAAFVDPAITRYVGQYRKTVRGLSGGKRQVGQHAPAGEDAFVRFVDYAAARLAKDPHFGATALPPGSH